MVESQPCHGKRTLSVDGFHHVRSGAAGGNGSDGKGDGAPWQRGVKFFC